MQRGCQHNWHPLLFILNSDILILNLSGFVCHPIRLRCFVDVAVVHIDLLFVE